MTCWSFEWDLNLGRYYCIHFTNYFFWRECLGVWVFSTCPSCPLKIIENNTVTCQENFQDLGCLMPLDSTHAITVIMRLKPFQTHLLFPLSHVAMLTWLWWRIRKNHFKVLLNICFHVFLIICHLYDHVVPSMVPVSSSEVMGRVV